MNSTNRIFAGALCAAALVAPAARAATPYSLDQMVSIHQQAVSANLSSLYSACSSGSSEQYYFTAIAMMGMLSSVEVTGDDNELQQVMHCADSMIAAASTVSGHKTWYPQSDVWNFQGAQGIARTAEVIWRNPTFK